MNENCIFTKRTHLEKRRKPNEGDAKNEFSPVKSCSKRTHSNPVKPILQTAMRRPPFPMTMPLEIISLLLPFRKDSRWDLPEFASIREISVKAFVFFTFFRGWIESVSIRVDPWLNAGYHSP
jgi:hypothetical protein